MAHLLIFNQDQSPFVAGNIYLIGDDRAIEWVNNGIAEVASEPITIDNATINVDLSSLNQSITGGTQTTKLVELSNLLQALSQEHLQN